MRYLLKWLLTAVAFVAFGCASLYNASEAWAAAALGFAEIALLVVLVAALHSKSFCSGGLPFPLSRRTPIGLSITFLLMTGLTSVIHPMAMADEGEQTNGASLNDDSANWIHGSGSDLEIRVHGEIIGTSVDQATRLKLTATQVGKNSETPLPPPRTSGISFHWWIPVGRDSQWHALRIEASSDDGAQRVTRLLTRGQIRQAANEGLVLRLEPASKVMEITVTHDGEPVADAHVVAKVMQNYSKVRGVTDGAGICRLNLLPDETLFMLTAWTDDYKFASYHFPRLADRDAAATVQTVELEQGHDQTIRFVDQDGSPVVGVPILLNVLTRNGTCFLQDIDQSRTRSGDEGETAFHWYPHGKDTSCTAHILDDRSVSHVWPIINGLPTDVRAQRNRLIRSGRRKGEESASDPDDDAIVFRLKPATERKRIAGKVTGSDRELGGINVELRSFQSDEVGRSDVRYVFTDSEGYFTADVLPNATYCFFVDDSRWVSDTIDLMPYRSVSEEVESPVLQVSDGYKIQVHVTEGPDRRPVANQFVNLRTNYDFWWEENGERRGGRSARSFGVFTDQHGIATAYAAAGICEASVYKPDWRATTKIRVEPGKENVGTLHRKIADSRAVIGRLQLAPDVEADLDSVEVVAGAIDGQTKRKITVVVSEDGNFTFETKAEKVGVFAMTRDKKAAGVNSTSELNQPLIVTLHPTGVCRGRLLDRDGKPATGQRKIHVVVRVADNRYAFSKPRGRSTRNPTFFEAKRIEAMTDQDGRYAVGGVPTNIEVQIRAEDPNIRPRTKLLNPETNRARARFNP